MVKSRTVTDEVQDVRRTSHRRLGTGLQYSKLEEQCVVMNETVTRECRMFAGPARRLGGAGGQQGQDPVVGGGDAQLFCGAWQLWSWKPPGVFGGVFDGCAVFTSRDFFGTCLEQMFQTSLAGMCRFAA